jgi:hypothetical protein
LAKILGFLIHTSMLQDTSGMMTLCDLQDLTDVAADWGRFSWTLTRCLALLCTNTPDLA